RRIASRPRRACDRGRAPRPGEPAQCAAREPLVTGAHLRSDRGAALITAILVAAFFLLIGSIASQQAVVSFLISHRITESAQALVAAETALAAALADMFRDPSFSRLARAD